MSHTKYTKEASSWRGCALLCWWDGSAGKGLCHQAWLPEDPHGAKTETTSTSYPLTMCVPWNTCMHMHTLTCTHMNSILFQIEAVLHNWKSMYFIFAHSLFQPPNDTFLAAEVIHLSYELFSDSAVLIGSSAAPQYLENHSCHPQKKALISHASSIAISLSL